MFVQRSSTKPSQQLKQGGNGISLSQKALLLHQQSNQSTSQSQLVSSSQSASHHHPQKQYVLQQPAYIHRAPVQADPLKSTNQSSQLLQQAA